MPLPVRETYLEVRAVDGGDVVYTYKVRNIGSSPVSNGVLTDRVGGTTVAGPLSFTLDVGEEQTFTSAATITQNTTNVVTVTGTNDAGQCFASDKVTVNVACVLGYPFTSGNPRTSIVFSEPENVGASAITTSPGSRKALKARASACPEPLATMMFSGSALNPSKRSYLWQMSSRRPRYPCGSPYVMAAAPSAFIMRAVASTMPS